MVNIGSGYNGGNMEFAMKSTVDEIRQRFDADVERFSNLDTGQSARVDAPLAMALIAQAAAATTPHSHHVLDVGCGAGNYTLKLLESLPNQGPWMTLSKEVPSSRPRS